MSEFSVGELWWLAFCIPATVFAFRCNLAFDINRWLEKKEEKERNNLKQECCHIMPKGERRKDE